MDYKYHYDRLIATRKNRELQEGVYYEKHHIIPKSMGGSNCKSNLVYLTAKEHYLAHLLLYKFSGSVSMVRAFVMISSRFKISGRIYEEARILKNKTMPKKEAHSCWGKKASPETLLKFSIQRKWRKLSDEHKAKISKANKGFKKPEDFARKGADNNNYKEVISTNIVTGEVVILGISETAKFFNVNRELITMRVRNKRRVKHPNAKAKSRRKLTDWDIRYNNDKAA